MAAFLIVGTRGEQSEVSGSREPSVDTRQSTPSQLAVVTEVVPNQNF